MKLEINDGVCQLTGTVEEMGQLIGEAQQAAQDAPDGHRRWLCGLVHAADQLVKWARFNMMSRLVYPVGKLVVTSPRPLVLLGPGGDFQRTWPKQPLEVASEQHAAVPA